MNQFQDKGDTIRFLDVLQIEKSERDDKEFTIITNNNVHHTFICKERARLLTEYNFYRVSHTYLLI